MGGKEGSDGDCRRRFVQTVGTVPGSRARICFITDMFMSISAGVRPCPCRSRAARGYALCSDFSVTPPTPLSIDPPLQEQGGKAAQEAAIEAALTEHGIDVIVLARYMQVPVQRPPSGDNPSCTVCRGPGLKPSAHGPVMYSQRALHFKEPRRRAAQEHQMWGNISHWQAVQQGGQHTPADFASC